MEKHHLTETWEQSLVLSGNIKRLKNIFKKHLKSELKLETREEKQRTAETWEQSLFRGISKGWEYLQKALKIGIEIGLRKPGNSLSFPRGISKG